MSETIYIVKAHTSSSIYGVFLVFAIGITYTNRLVSTAWPTFAVYNSGCVKAVCTKLKAELILPERVTIQSLQWLTSKGSTRVNCKGVQGVKPPQAIAHFETDDVSNLQKREEGEKSNRNMIIATLSPLFCTFLLLSHFCFFPVLFCFKITGTDTPCPLWCCSWWIINLIGVTGVTLGRTYQYKITNDPF